MIKNDSLGDRMKENYENRAKTFLTRRMPVIIRIDGKAFHTFTRGFKKPYDTVFHYAMNQTMKYLCENVQGCKFGYTQSDEITLILTDYDTLTTDAWFNYGVQKICSVAASMSTMAFNRFLADGLFRFIGKMDLDDHSEDEYTTRISAAVGKAMFDARCFNIPKEEVTNCLIWRQQDATRNAIQMLGQCNFSHKELNGKSCSDIQDMLMTQRGVNFNDMPVAFKRGVCCIKTADGWTIDEEPPIFTSDRDYVERSFLVGEA